MRVLLLLCIGLCCFKCVSQENDSYEFIGTLQTSDGAIMTYKLNFKELEGGIIEGYSLTDFKGEQRTKSKIKGTLNSKDKIISFKELANISTRSNAKPNEFCYVNVKNAIIKIGKEKSIIQGKFKGVFENDSSCVNGYLYLLSTDFLFKQLDKAYMYLDTTKMADSVKRAALNKQTTIKNSIDQNYLNTDGVLKIKWDSEEIILELWDAEKVDQDRITIYINNKKIADNFLIQHEKKYFVIPFNENKCIIKIVANNEGESPPNTAHIILKDGNAYTPIVTNLRKEETAIIVLEKSK